MLHPVENEFFRIYHHRGRFAAANSFSFIKFDMVLIAISMVQLLTIYRILNVKRCNALQSHSVRLFGNTWKFEQVYENNLRVKYSWTNKSIWIRNESPSISMWRFRKNPIDSFVKKKCFFFFRSTSREKSSSVHLLDGYSFNENFQAMNSNQIMCKLKNVCTHSVMYVFLRALLASCAFDCWIFTVKTKYGK